MHHVPQRARVFVERTAAALHAHRFRGRDLHVVDVLAIEERLEGGIAEAEREQVLDRVLAQVVVDAVDLLGLQVFEDAAVQVKGTRQIAAERFLDYRPRPLVRLLARQAIAGETRDEGHEEFRVGRQVEEAVARQLLRCSSSPSRRPNPASPSVVVKSARW